MKIGFCMLLWATEVNDSHTPIIEDLKRTGYDGVEIPCFGGTPGEYAAIGRRLDALELGRTAISIVPTPEQDPLSDDPAVRKSAIAYMQWLIDCTVALGANQVAGPLHQVLGQFSGEAPTEAERARMREFHLTVGDYAKTHDVTIALEAVNRFESYFANTMDDLCAYVRSVGHPNISSMYDTFHANIEEADPVAAFVRNAADVAHIHISENDRGVPGRGHVPWAETFNAIKSSGYDGWLTIEAFGRGLPDLAAATRVWRDFAENPEAVYREGFRTIRDGWDAV
jgi:D-psicose/D-tagatose/L-ribulose 3-epimerase